MDRLCPLDDAYQSDSDQETRDEDFLRFKKSLEESLKPGDPLQVQMQKNKQQRLLYIHRKRKEILNFT